MNPQTNIFGEPGIKLTDAQKFQQANLDYNRELKRWQLDQCVRIANKDTSYHSTLHQVYQLDLYGMELLKCVSCAQVKDGIIIQLAQRWLAIFDSLEAHSGVPK